MDAAGQRCRAQVGCASPCLAQRLARPPEGIVLGQLVHKSPVMHKSLSLQVWPHDSYRCPDAITAADPQHMHHVAAAVQ